MSKAIDHSPSLPSFTSIHSAWSYCRRLGHSVEVLICGDRWHIDPVTGATPLERRVLEEMFRQQEKRIADIESEDLAHQEWLKANPDILSLAERDNARFAGRTVQFVGAAHRSRYGHVVSSRRPDPFNRPNSWELRIRISHVGHQGIIDPDTCVLSDLNDVKFID